MSDQSNKNTPDYESEIKNREEKIKSLEKDEIPTESYSDNISIIKERTKDNILNFIKYWFYFLIKIIKVQAELLLEKFKKKDL